MLNYKDRLEFCAEVEEAYKRYMQPIYKKWSKQYSTPELREEFFFYICRRQHEKIVELIGGRKRRKIRLAKVKTELASLKLKQAIDNPLGDFTDEDFKKISVNVGNILIGPTDEKNASM